MWALSGFADEISADLEEQCRVLGELGIGFVEFRGAWDINVLDLQDDQLDRVAKLLAAHNLRTSSVGSPIGKIGIHDDFTAHLHRLDRALHVADRLGAPVIRIFSFFMPRGDDPAVHRDEVVRRMAGLCERAAGHEVLLVHENEKHIYGDTPQRCLDIIESVGLPNLRLTWDAANFVQCGFRPHTEGYQLLRPYLNYIQIKDALLGTGEVVPAGEGDGEVRETIRALRADGFDGVFSLEPHLASAGAMGGFSGAELFTTAHRAFTRLLADEGIDYR